MKYRHSRDASDCWGNFSTEQFFITFVTAGVGVGTSDIIGNAYKASSQLAQNITANILASGVVGGLASAMLGGNFFEGFATGAIVAGASIGLGRAVERIQQNAALNTLEKDRAKRSALLDEMIQENTIACEGCDPAAYLTKKIKVLWKDFVEKVEQLDRYLEGQQQRGGETVKDPNTKPGQQNPVGDAANDLTDYGVVENAVPAGTGKPNQNQLKPVIIKGREVWDSTPMRTSNGYHYLDKNGKLIRFRR